MQHVLRGRGRRLAATAIVLTAGLTGVAEAAKPVAKPKGTVTITRTAQSIPNIVADNYVDAGYGVGFATTEDNVCILAEMWLNLSAQRSLHFGPSGVNNDLYYAYVNKTAPLQEMFDAPPPQGPTQDVADMIDGYVAGYNAYLEETGVENIPDARCRGKAWVRPIDRMDVMRRVYDLIGYGGRDLVRAGTMAATPPTPSATAPNGGSTSALGRVAMTEDLVARTITKNVEGVAATDPTDQVNIIKLAQAFADRANEWGSNALGLGKDAMDNGSGGLVANPHWTWDGANRFWQMHVKIKDAMHVSGMGFLGQPAVMIGHNENVAWSHTVSAARRLAIAEVQLVPGYPTKYLVDGVPRDMDQTKVKIPVREADGSITTREKTFYRTIYGEVTTAVLGIPALPWTPTSAYSLVDMNDRSARIMNQFFESNNAGSVDELYAAHAKYASNPWATTTAADDKGNTLFTDVGTVPNISNEHAALCNTPLGHGLWNSLGLAVLKGSISSCAVPTDKSSAAPMVMPAERQPVQKRTDYVSNSNESHWLTNARQPLEGYSRVFGPERMQRAMRTRLGHKIVLDRLEGRDGSGKTKFSRQDLQDALFNNRHHLAELWVDDLVTACRTSPQMPGSSGPVNVSKACDVLAKWDRTMNLDSPGSVLFQRIADRTQADTDFLTSYVGAPGIPMWKQPYTPGDPVGTPKGLNPAYGVAYQAFADAVAELNALKIPLDGSLRDYQITTYGGESRPLHGGKASYGLFNAMNTGWSASSKRYNAGGGGPSFVMVTQFGNGCPDDRSLLLGSQRSQSSGWSRSGDQVELYSKKEWVDPPFCDDEVAAAEHESVTVLDEKGVKSVK